MLLIFIHSKTFKKTKNHQKITQNNSNVPGNSILDLQLKKIMMCIVITSSDQYEELIKELNKFKGSTSLSFREKQSTVLFRRNSKNEIYNKNEIKIKKKYYFP